jgi:hypothetical protein
MNSDVTKRTLSAGLGVGALALLARRASADTPFSSFAFPATGAPTARTLPDRFAEIKNVKDFGAKGNGTTDDTAAIRAAANLGGTVFFPAGTYKVTETIALPSGSFVTFYGANAASIAGDVNGYVIDVGNDGLQDSGSISLLGFHLTNAGQGQRGGIRINHGVNCVIRECSMEANRCVTLWNTISSEVSNCILRPGQLSPVELGKGQGRSVPGAIGIFSGAEPTAQTGASVNSCVHCVDLAGFESAIRIQGVCSVRNARIEMCNEGISLGITETGGEYASSSLMEHLELEANGVHIRVVGNARLSVVGMLGDIDFSGDMTDGKESRVGLLVSPGSRVVADMVGIDGHYRDAAVKFEGWLDHSVFTSVIVNFAQPGDPIPPLPGSVPWRGMNLIGAGNATFIQCNQPPA